MTLSFIRKLLAIKGIFLSKKRNILHFFEQSTEKGSASLKNDNIPFSGYVFLDREELADLPFLYIPLSNYVGKKVVLIPVEPTNTPDIYKGIENKDCYSFRFTLPPNVQRANVYIKHDNHLSLIERLDLSGFPHAHKETQQGKLKVLKGKDGWLFLDNDTNYNVEQLCGNLVINDKCLEEWSEYIESFVKIKNNEGRHCALIIAPSKEIVMSHYYPRRIVRPTILKPILDLIPKEILVYPAKNLKTMGDSAFLKTDTHWTNQGAKTAAILTAKRLGLNLKEINKKLSKDRYKEKKHSGDLGNKFANPQSSSESFLISFSYRNWIIYDNALPNFGRLVVINYPDALTHSTCLLFGSSSSYSMLNYLCRFFSKLIFIHTAGNLDLDVIRNIKPDYLIAQTNARFMIRPPISDYDVAQTIREKLNHLDEEQLAKQKKNMIIKDLEMAMKLGIEKQIRMIPTDSYTK
ncbi:alginate O-acetyltransferase AlgX-related protein [Zobellella denitrificans]